MRAHTGRRGPGAAPGWGREALAGLRWYVAVPVCAGGLLLAAGVFLLTTSRPARPLATGCGLVSCSASLPPAITAARTGGGPSGRPTALRPAARPSPRMWLRARPRATAVPQAGATSTAVPAGSAGPTSSPAPPVPGPPPGAVTYTLDHRWPGGFMGHFTIVNNGGAPLRGWMLTATLPGDHIESVWGASARSNGNTLTLTPAPYQPVISPGASLSAYFTAAGTSPWPTACAFNAQPCGA